MWIVEISFSLLLYGVIFVANMEMHLYKTLFKAFSLLLYGVIFVAKVGFLKKRIGFRLSVSYFTE